MMHFIAVHKFETLLALAVLAGVWRVIDGRGKEWLPLPTWARNLGTLCVASVISVLTLGVEWSALWAAVVASLALIRGFPDGTWESLPKNIWHWFLPAAILTAPLLYFGVIPLDCAATYIALNIFTGCVYYSISIRKIGPPIAYLTEFSAGFNASGMILILNM